MIFKQWAQVKDGTKAQTRRPVKEDEFAVNQHDHMLPYPPFGGDEIDTVYSAMGAMKWQVARTYAVQPGRGKKSVGRIRITKIRRERLGDISDEDCFAEGVIEKPLASFGNTGLVYVAWQCPVCGETLNESPIAAYACLWNHVYDNGAWERMKDDDVWVLEFERCEE